MCESLAQIGTFCPYIVQTQFAPSLPRSPCLHLQLLQCSRVGRPTRSVESSSAVPQALHPILTRWRGRECPRTSAQSSNGLGHVHEAFSKRGEHGAKGFWTQDLVQRSETLFKKDQEGMIATCYSLLMFTACNAPHMTTAIAQNNRSELKRCQVSFNSKIEPEAPIEP